MTAAELIQRYPEVVEPLRDGRLSLSTVVEVARVITPGNRGEVLPRYFHLSKREAKEVTAELQPCAAPQRTVVVPLKASPAASVLSAPAPCPDPAFRPDEPARSAVQDDLPRNPPAAPRASPAAPPRPPPADVVPLTADLSRMHLTVSRRFLEKLAAARAALSHSHPGATEEEILAAGLDLLVERHAKRRGLVEKPKPEPKPSKRDDQAPTGVQQPSKRDDTATVGATRPSRRNGYIPAHVRRAVWLRDGGKCSWKLQGGGVCGSTHQLEYDHIRPKALGGASTVDNVRLGCRFHNLLAAREVFGDAQMDRYTRGGARPRRDAQPAP